MNIIFDFDGTIAKSTQYHRAGWEQAIKELGLTKELSELLPYEENLKERFDSYRRIKKGFLSNVIDYGIISTYFGLTDKDQLARKIMDLKESLTITSILEEDIAQTLENLGLNFIEAINSLKSKDNSISVISSSRETIISSYLHKCGLLDLFDYIWGEESLTDELGVLYDKPHPYFKGILRKTNYPMNIYIGDNGTIDKEFAEICGGEFIYADKNTDFLKLVKNIK